MEYLYKPSELERYISDMYKKIGIIYPSQLDEEYIARKFNIEIIYTRWGSFCNYSDDFQLISLHKDLRFNPIRRREVFFHELGHLLRHAGDQTNMSFSFRDFQESQARRFTLFAAIPHHMLRYIDFSQKRDYVLYEMQETFRISKQICSERLDYIENRMLNEKLEFIYERY
ncbi:ImmA/IrrE family metallo-endopeptidase [Anoxybacteroides rupiense]|uniref:ImmA/IrrE family metallo-endopeptidase n=1 Tax=Anoxybacteroides rupiense TaxID=311460 RepID=UPI0036700D34